ncbi:hypothetical protein NQ317_017370 [Molorchus minor]|uniref:Reverse transcriptase zinc-binding domain-containing protein n=1 Tax=Molorchus minor TaxID=1323400 RepID=A0ABQ9JRV4_9CUCU|nr:hypothetical protein NQ317_017370 [Molorchus minor]
MGGKHIRGSTGGLAEVADRQRELVSGPNRSRVAWLLGHGRNTLNRLIRVITGLCRLRRHLNPNCPGCGDAEETAFHFLGQCEAFGRLRFVIFVSVTLRREELVSLNWSQIVSFIRRTKRFDEIISVNRIQYNLCDRPALFVLGRYCQHTCSKLRILIWLDPVDVEGIELL